MLAIRIPRAGAAGVLALALAAGPAAAEDTVRVAAAAINVAHGPIALAVTAPEIFGAHDIAVEVQDLRGASPNCIAALLSESVELCQVGTTTGTDAIAEGADLVAVAVLTGPIAELILATDTVAGLPVGADAPIDDRIRALKGLNLVSAAPGSANYTLLDSMLSTVDMSISDVNYRTLGEVPAMIEAIRNKQIDGAFWVIGSLGPLMVEGSGVRWISLARGDVEDYNGLPFVSVFARRDWAEANPDLVDRIHAGYADSIARLKGDADRSSELIRAEYFPDLDPALWADGYGQGELAFLDGARTDADAWQRLLDLQQQTSGKDYTDASFDRVVVPAAQVN